MKKVNVILCSLIMGITLTLNAQAPYKHSIGATTLNLNGVSYKTFLTDNLALSVDAGVKWTVTSIWGFSGVPLSAEVNPNVMYEALAGPIYWFAGGGVSIGGWGAGKFGLNAIGGVEYKFSKIPLTIQGDFRPGYGLTFGNGGTFSYFDWGICASVRYTFQ